MNISAVGFDDCGTVYQNVRIYSIDNMTVRTASLGLIMKDGQLLLKASELPVPEGEFFYVAGIGRFPGDETVYQLSSEGAESGILELVGSEHTEQHLEDIINKL